jgi:predicted  nucleic acid-binding Zn-ribbon protein
MDMEPELKTYLDGMEVRINEQLIGLDGQFKSVRAEISDVRVELLEVINDVKDNTATILERLDNNLKTTERTVSEHDRRLDKIEDNMRVVKTKLAI